MSKSLTGIGMGLLVGFMVTSADGQVIRFVDDDAVSGGDGLTWITAYHDLQDALDEALLSTSAVTEIRVAMGTYTPDRGTGNVNLSFRLVNGVSLLGGYEGIGAVNPDSRDINLYPTVLSADIAGDDNPDVPESFLDNSRSTLLGFGIDAGTILEGIIISQKGSQNFFSVSFFNSELMIRNCRFQNDTSVRLDGSSAVIESCTFIDLSIIALALFNQSNPSITGCSFTSNGNGGITGGALRISGNSNPVITDCSFIGNGGPSFLAPLVESGGAIHMSDSTGTVIRNCTFSENRASLQGGAVFSTRSMFQIEDCTFSDNGTLAAGGAVAIISQSNTTITNCTFNLNAIEPGNPPGPILLRGGGAVACKDSDLDMTGCILQNNTSSTANGGSVLIEGSASGNTVSLTQCQFSGNGGGSLNGGAVHATNVLNINVNDCTFLDNFTSSIGGALYCEQSGLLMRDSTFTGNNTRGAAGAVAIIRQSVALVENCTFRSNSIVPSAAQGSSPILGGGAFACKESNLTMVDCLLEDNNVFNFNGGGISIVGSTIASNVIMINCQLLKNSCGGSGGGLFSTQSLLTISECTFFDNHAGSSGGGASVFGISNQIVSVNNTLFDTNLAGISGGGFYHDGELGTLVFNRCDFINNTTLGRAGGLEIAGDDILINCLVNTNSATSTAGAIYLRSFRAAKIHNSTITNNQSTLIGGIAGFADDSDPSSKMLLANSILWGNFDNSGISEPVQISFTDLNNAVIDHNCIQGLTGALGGVGNIGDDPELICDGPSGCLELTAGSPCIDTGNNSMLPTGTTTDTLGNPRIVNDIVDMGAFEFQGQVCLADCAPPGGNGLVNVTDLLQLLATWGSPDAACDIAPPGGDGVVNVSDLLLVLASWGDCPE
ncbi:MAG: hypothetical protein IID30_11840 [Planctomycetes bacterium]|nr:hypothetical protein [Planctomycetota bacterium]